MMVQISAVGSSNPKEKHSRPFRHNKICANEVLLNGTSRTDAGVHALGQRASFTSNFSIPYERIPEVANSLLAKWTRQEGAN